MAQKINIQKLNAAPETLAANTLYLVKHTTGNKLEIILTDISALTSFQCFANGDVTSLNSKTETSAATASTIMSRDANADTNVAAINANNWFNSSGSTGWKNTTYGGGWYMTDSSWIRSYGSKVVYVNNDILATGNVTSAYSDMRLKEYVRDLNDALEIIDTIDGFRYRGNEVAKEFGYGSDEVEIGFNASQMQYIVPEIVTLAPFDLEVNEDGQVYSRSGQNYLTVRYDRYVPILSMGVRLLHTKHKQLEERVSQLEQEIAMLKELIMKGVG